MSRTKKKMAVYPDAADIISSARKTDSQLSELTNISRPSIRKLKNSQPVTESVYQRFMAAIGGAKIGTSATIGTDDRQKSPPMPTERSRPKSQLQVLELIKQDLERLHQSLGWLSDDGYRFGLKLNRDQVGPIVEASDEAADKAHRILRLSM